MKPPTWYRCSSCGSTGPTLDPWPRVYSERPARGWSSEYAMFAPGSALWCFPLRGRRGCLPVTVAEWHAAYPGETVAMAGQIGLGL